MYTFRTMRFPFALEKPVFKLINLTTMWNHVKLSTLRKTVFCNFLYLHVNLSIALCKRIQTFNMKSIFRWMIDCLARSTFVFNLKYSAQFKWWSFKFKIKDSVNKIVVVFLSKFISYLNEKLSQTQIIIWYIAWSFKTENRLKITFHIIDIFFEVLINK